MGAYDVQTALLRAYRVRDALHVRQAGEVALEVCDVGFCAIPRFSAMRADVLQGVVSFVLFFCESEDAGFCAGEGCRGRESDVFCSACDQCYLILSKTHDA